MLNYKDKECNGHCNKPEKCDHNVTRNDRPFCDNKFIYLDGTKVKFKNGWIVNSIEVISDGEKYSDN